jgi:HSP20 family molecular chaperone IbpA
VEIAAELPGVDEADVKVSVAKPPEMVAKKVEIPINKAK